MHGDYVLPVLLVTGRVGVAGGRPCPDAWPLERTPSMPIAGPPTREAARGVYPYASILLPDIGPGAGYQPITGGTQPPDPLRLETLAQSAQPAAAQARYRYYPVSAFVESVPSLPPPAAHSVFNPAQAR
jgi:hypothetical protein